MFIRVLNTPSFELDRVKSLRKGIMAGAPCPIDVMRKVMTFAPEMTICYGMTEVYFIHTARFNVVSNQTDLLVDESY